MFGNNERGFKNKGGLKWKTHKNSPPSLKRHPSIPWTALITHDPLMRPVWHVSLKHQVRIPTWRRDGYEICVRNPPKRVIVGMCINISLVSSQTTHKIRYWWTIQQPCTTGCFSKAGANYHGEPLLRLSFQIGKVCSPTPRRVRFFLGEPGNGASLWKYLMWKITV